MNTLDIAKEAAKILSSKKAYGIKVIDVHDVTTLADYFVIAVGSNSTQVKALADEVEFKLKEKGVYPHHVEGKHSNTWILLDYQDIVIHVFLEETRDFYNLERLWNDGKIVDIEE